MINLLKKNNNYGKTLKGKNFKKNLFSLFNKNILVLIFISFSLICILCAVHINLFKIPEIKEKTSEKSIEFIQTISAHHQNTKQFINENKEILTNITLNQKSLNTYYDLIKISFANSIKNTAYSDFFMLQLFKAQLLSQEQKIDNFTKTYQYFIISFFIFLILTANTIIVQRYFLLQKILNTKTINIKNLNQFLQNNKKNIKSIYLNTQHISQYFSDYFKRKNVAFIIFENNSVVIVENALVDTIKFNQIISSFKTENYEEKENYYLLD